MSDAALGLTDHFQIRDVGGNPVGGDIARPATILLAPDGRILWAHFADNYRVRPEPEELLGQVKAAMNPASAPAPPPTPN